MIILCQQFYNFFIFLFFASRKRKPEKFFGKLFLIKYIIFSAKSLLLLGIFSVFAGFFPYFLLIFYLLFIHFLHQNIKKNK